jgi:hypothetical protein
MILPDVEIAPEPAERLVAVIAPPEMVPEPAERLVAVRLPENVEAPVPWPVVFPVMMTSP